MTHFMATQEEIGERIKRARIAAGFRTATDAARALGMEYPTYASHENGSRDQSKWLGDYAKKYKVTVDWLANETGAGPNENGIFKTPAIFRPIAEDQLPAVGNMPKDIPVYGTAAGAELGRGAFQLTPDIVDYVRRPPALADSKAVYALYVEGDSMSPRFEPGELIYVNPNRPVRVGDYVVIQEPTDSDGSYNAWVKAFVKRSSEWVTVRQLNPDSELRFKATEGLRVHKVLTTSEILGL